MCGICGLLTTDLAIGSGHIVRPMTAAMRHRGPDGEGFMQAPGVALGMRRLRIIDLATGDQPIYNEDRTVAVISNGEIYNYRALTSELKSRGHRFETRSDTEAIVHAYEEWGPDCVHRLRGMFAFAVCDRRPQTTDRIGGRLFLARDRLGIKPLYYCHRGGLFLFASEVRALLASGLVPRRLSLDGLASYLAYGSVQEPLTLIDGVYSLPPGHRMTIPSADGRALAADGRLQIAVDRYWDFPTPEVERWKSGSERPNREKVVPELRELLAESVGLRLISDVPLGAFLSSGIDSSAVVALMSQASDLPVKTFTIGFVEQEFSEAGLARAMVRRCGAEHHEIIVTPQQVLADLPQALTALDQPSIDGINTYYVSGATKRAGLTVVLSGLGGDEIFAGYGTFRTVPHMQALQQVTGVLPYGIRRVISHGLSIFPFPFPLLPSSFSPDARRKLAALVAEEVQFSHPYFLARALFTPAQVAALLTREARDHLIEESPWHRRAAETLARAQMHDPINAVSFLESTHYLISTLLRDTDQMSMAHSLEVRVPLIDHELVEFMMGLPGPDKVDGRTPKHLLVKALEGAIPDEVVYRPKTKFTFPWESWLRRELREEVESTLRNLPQALVAVLNGEAVIAVWEQFVKRRTSWSRPWSLYVLFRWSEKHLLGRSEG
ncbi:MAG: asparagine synthase (glutamine-hydrolyzing) [Anaerolineae bacterium]